MSKENERKIIERAENRSYKRKKVGNGEIAVIEKDDMSAIISLAKESLKRNCGMPAKYENSADGFEKFVNATSDFFDFVAQKNQELEPGKQIIPDVENWTLYIGITRKTLADYGRRSETWCEYIERVKNALAACKKALAMRCKIPPVVMMFDFANNHGYKNTSEFKLTTESVQSESEKIEDELRESGLVWNEETQSFEEEGV